MYMCLYMYMYMYMYMTHDAKCNEVPQQDRVRVLAEAFGIGLRAEVARSVNLPSEILRQPSLFEDHLSTSNCVACGIR